MNCRILSLVILSFTLMPFSSSFAQETAQEAQTIHKWKMATSWSGGTYFEQAKSFADRVKQTTNGRVDIKVFPGGALGNALKVSETVSNGVAEIGHTWPGYDWGKDKTAVLFGGWAGGMDAEQTFHWLYEAGGKELYQEFRKEKFNLHVFPVGVAPTEVFLHSQKPVRTLDDLKGLKIRTSGSWLEISKNLGASPVTSAGSEVYQMLERGVVDATEWASPAANLPMGFHKIAPYVIIPGLHQPTTVIEVLINQEAWDKLSKHDQLMVEIAAKLSSFENWVSVGYNDMHAMQTFRDNKNEIIELDDTVKAEAKRHAQKWGDTVSTKNEGFAKVLKHQRDFQTLWESGESYRNVR